ncbi:c-x8-c-x5-c-x3-h zinc finger [Fusarium longipes]|uniref:C-x8-c-x5-c-x3-h zinc finger n=1 Tax=Fusarium longipes TaxID=694270 RepID=A0A395S8A0_9HYPO|nr:c-x8-c-x5-c-x3-h zinc finger [Fusarium longipes]
METASFNDFVQRYNNIQAYESAKDKLLQDVLIYCKAIESDSDKENQKLKSRLNEVELDLKAATKTRRDLQKSLEEAELQVKWIMRENDEIKNTNSYVLILIDGDGLLGLEGGKSAARALRTAVAQLCSHERTGSLEIICRVVANVGGLSKALFNEGCIENIGLFRDFTLGFTQSKASFDFLDVGFGKERADAKIRGIGHDAGYAPFLEEVVHDDESRHCVSLMKGPPLVRELENLQMNVIEFDGIFRSTKLMTDKSSALATSTQRTLPIRNPTSATGSAPSTQAAVLTPATSTASLSPPNASWAKITKSATPPPQLTIPLPPKQAKSKATTKAPAQPSWSPGPRGVDPTVTVGLSAMENIKRRAGNEKLCNNHYLRGPCGRMDICPFVHNYKATQDDLLALAMLSRQNPCTAGQECDVDDCIYGHNCPNVVNVELVLKRLPPSEVLISS